MIDFFLAGTQTIQFATQTIISHFATAPDSLKMVREEFEYFAEDKIYEDPSLKKLSKEE